MSPFGPFQTCRARWAMSVSGGQSGSGADRPRLRLLTLNGSRPAKYFLRTDRRRLLSGEYGRLYCHVLIFWRSFANPIVPLFCTGEYLMTLSNVTRRGMIGGLGAGVSAAALISSDRFISGARAQSARKTFVLVPGAFLGLGLGVAFQTSSKSRAIRSIRSH